ncbi:hypothetical protein JW868_02770 [Candidatus Woesearchaeota archaeon]|nr:hypothetical protein [Candidatus Woesearchaeota archaeon]
MGVVPDRQEPGFFWIVIFGKMLYTIGEIKSSKQSVEYLEFFQEFHVQEKTIDA